MGIFDANDLLAEFGELGDDDCDLIAQNDRRVKSNPQAKHKPVGSISSQYHRAEVNQNYAGLPKVLKKRK